MLKTEDGRFLPESNAILLYLVDGNRACPTSGSGGQGSCSRCSSSSTATEVATPRF
jgi:glutathione S-transferase